MKRFILLIIIAIFSFNCIQSQDKWEDQFFDPDDSYISIFFLDTLNGWITSTPSNSRYNDSIGNIHRTIDGGKTWIKYKVLKDRYLRKVQFLNPKEGFGIAHRSSEIGMNDYFCLTNDSGKTWQKITSLNQENFRYLVLSDLSFFDRNHGVVAATLIDSVSGFYSQTFIYKTTDGGNSWISKKVLPKDYYNFFYLSNCFQLSVNKIIVNTTNGRILLTEDGGDKWETVFYDSSDTYFRRLIFNDNLNGWTGGRKRLLKTTDGGLNWHQVLKDTNNISITDLYFIDKNTGWYIDNYKSTKTLSTTDGGDTWIPFEINQLLPGISRIFFNENKTGWAISFSKILSTQKARFVPKPRIYCEDTVICEGQSTWITFWPDSGSIKYYWSTGDTAHDLYPTKSGRYTVYVENEFGKDSASIDIKVVAKFPQPKLNISGRYELCAGESIKLFTKDMYRYFTWQDGSTNSLLDLSKAGIYYVDVMDGEGDCVVRSDSLIVIIIQPDSLQLTQDSDSFIFDVRFGKTQTKVKKYIAFNDSIVINNLFLFFDNSEFSLTTIPQVPIKLKKNDTLKIYLTFAPTKYGTSTNYIKFEFLNKCTNKMLEVSGVTLTSVNNENQVNFFLSPNPASDYIQISVGAQCAVPDGVSIGIFDVLGIEQPTSPQPLSLLGEGVMRLDVSALAQGVYFVRLGDKVQKFVKL